MISPSITAVYKEINSRYSKKNTHLCHLIIDKFALKRKELGMFLHKFATSEGQLIGYLNHTGGICILRNKWAWSPTHAEAEKNQQSDYKKKHQ